MKIKLKTIMASPEGVAQPGDVLELPNGAELVAAGFAESLEPVKEVQDDVPAEPGAEPGQPDAGELPDGADAKPARGKKAK